MVNGFLTALLLASTMLAASFATAAEPGGAGPAQALNERITDGRVDGDRPDKPVGRSLDPLGPARPEGLAPAAPHPGGEPAECRGLPRDARAACQEGSSRMRQEAPLPGGTPGIPAPQELPDRPAGDR